MIVYNLMVTTYSDSPYCQWEWVCRGLFFSAEQATEAGEAYLKDNPDEEYSVEGIKVQGEPLE